MYLTKYNVLKFQRIFQIFCFVFKEHHLTEYYNLLSTKELSIFRNDSLKNKENWFIF